MLGRREIASGDEGMIGTELKGKIAVRAAELARRIREGGAPAEVRPEVHGAVLEVYREGGEAAALLMVKTLLDPIMMTAASDGGHLPPPAAPDAMKEYVGIHPVSDGELPMLVHRDSAGVGNAVAVKNVAEGVLPPGVEPAAGASS